MKKFVKNTLIFSILLVIFLGLIFGADYYWIKNQYEESYVASLNDKVDRLMSINEPKIILVGNSNVAFGVRSEMLEETFGMPVVNLGLHGGLGNKFHENIAKLNINKDDIVIICHSNYGDNGTIGDISLAWISLELQNNLWKLVSDADRLNFWKAYPNYIKESLILKLTGTGNRASDDCYSRKAFNKYGDNIYSESQKETYIFTEGELEVPTISDACVDRINNLNDYVKERGATLLIAGYPIADGPYTPDRTEYYAFEKKLKERMNCPVISNVDDYFMDYNYFYNTTLHLTNDGAIKRIEQLITDLKNYLN